MDTIKAIEDRRSIRKYKDVKVSKEQILDILNAGRKAPSYKNRQNWKFVLIEDYAKELQEAGIETNDVSPLLLPKYARHER